MAGWGMVAPVVIGLTVFQLSPLVWAMTESVQAFNPMTHRSIGFVGSENFERLFADPVFWRALGNTLVYGVGITLIEVAAALGIALLLHRVVPGTRFARSMVIAALAAAESIMALLWFTIYNRDTGLANSILEAIGLSGIPWLTSEQFAIPSIMIMSIWKDVGLPTLIFLAGLQSLDEDLYGASSLDGANAWQQFRHVTLPLLNRSTIVAVFMVTIGATRIFTPILLMTSGGPNASSTNLIYYAYDQGFHYLDYGVGSAATVCMMVLLAAVTIVQGVALKGRR
ncbi:MAG: araP [Microbacterium sp.]|jgi:ABC-type sugar transport system permease subunit|nr:araP [Microbacterium sp.]